MKFKIEQMKNFVPDNAIISYSINEMVNPGWSRIIVTGMRHPDD